jgi:alkylated DNA repair dioxygenase AlkB
MKAGQLDLFAGPAELPEGFRYGRDLVGRAEAARLLRRLAALPFAPFEFHGFEGNRRILSFGWQYRFDGSGLAAAEPIPEFLLPLRSLAADFAGVAPEVLEHALLTEYAPGAGIGWHRDRSVFGDTVGISLASPCRLRFRRRRTSGGWDRAALVVEPRSVYLLRGASRSLWEHSIPPVGELRYSITFRSLAAP